MNIVVGLGNPGEKYYNTRHNIGFLVLDSLLEKHKATSSVFWHEDKRLKSLLKTIQYADCDVLLVKPQTYMNLSGEAVQRVMQEYHAKLEDLVVVYDDLDLSVGELRIRREGGSGGHNGVQSIIDSIGEEFVRIRIGIGRPKEVENSKLRVQSLVEDYVLEQFSAEEQGVIKNAIGEAAQACEGILEHGFEHYMSKFYKKS